MEITNSFSKWDNIRSITSRFKSEIDRPHTTFNKDSAKKAYKDFLKEKIKNPTIADSAMQELSKKEPIKDPSSYYINLCKLQQEPDILKLKDELAKTITTYYPKNYTLRKEIISARKCELDSIPHKLGRFKKIMIFLKSIL